MSCNLGIHLLHVTLREVKDPVFGAGVEAPRPLGLQHQVHAVSLELLEAWKRLKWVGLGVGLLDGEHSRVHLHLHCLPFCLPLLRLEVRFLPHFEAEARI